MDSIELSVAMTDRSIDNETAEETGQKITFCEEAKEEDFTYTKSRMKQNGDLSVLFLFSHLPHTSICDANLHRQCRLSAGFRERLFRSCLEKNASFLYSQYRK